MQPQHAFDPDRRTPRPVGLGVDRLDHRHQVRPGHHAIHFVEEPLSAGGFAIVLKWDFCKGLLVHGGVSR
ncbi:MAG: hypothetical protein E8D40_01745 [Nitrospira sp.]|nr:MAG: hypothetical protein E8D40_01745 [Nitrospira sp.]